VTICGTHVIVSVQDFGSAVLAGAFFMLLLAWTVLPEVFEVAGNKA